jgi:membrane fusion protein, multidrug efflux system
MNTRANRQGRDRWTRSMRSGRERIAWLSVVILPFVLTAACGREAIEAPRAAAATAPVARGVRVAPAVVETVREGLEAVGTVRSKTQTLIASKVQGYVREVRIREGDIVEPGGVLVLVDDRELVSRSERAQAALAESRMARDEVVELREEAEAALRSAEADHRYAEATATRYRQLLDKELISVHEYEGTDARRKSAAAAVGQAKARILGLTARERQARQRIEQARAELDSATIALGDTRIAAPATGVVVERRVEPGNLAVPGQTLLTLDDPRHYRLEAEVGESAIGRVHPGQSAPVVVDAIGRTLEGRVAEMIPTADPASRSMTVKLDLPPVAGLRSGMFGRARFVAGERNALLVPAGALVERGQLTGVYVVDAQSVARLRLVTAGQRRGDRVEILSGLNPGEGVVIEGVDRVTDGGRVETPS